MIDFQAIELIDEGGLSPEGFYELAEEVAKACLAIEGLQNAYASVTLVKSEEIRRINRETRNVDAETDVLSFPEIAFPAGKTAGACERRVKRAYDPVAGKIFLGDIVINTRRAMEQARAFGHAYRRELGYLTAHAMFHLMGYDHMTDADKKRMREREKEAMRRVRLYREEDEGIMKKKMQALAMESLKLSYSPYSRFRVGACLLSENGNLYQGANFENASYGATICAERCAVGNAIAHGEHRFTQIAIACDEGYAWPCGICRQVLNEFKAGEDMLVMVGGENAPWQEKMLSELLPDSFGPKDLNIQEE